MSRLNLSSISRFFSTSSTSRAQTSSNTQPSGSGKSKPASVNAALSPLSPRESHTPSTSPSASQRPRAAQLPGKSKKQVAWAAGTRDKRPLAQLMDDERSTELTKWGIGLKGKMPTHPIDDPELQEIANQIDQNIWAQRQGMLYDSDSDSESEIRPASRHPTVDNNAMLRQAGLLDD